MRVVLQRCSNANVSVDNKIVGEITDGLVLFVSFKIGDDINVVDKMVNKIINLRIFSDSNDKLNLSILDVNKSILSISQFTLYATLNGRRPSFSNVLDSDSANKLYDYFNSKLKENNLNVQQGIFKADMKVNVSNDGPITIILDSINF